METALGFGASLTLLRVVPELRVGQLSELDEFETGLGPRLVEEVREDAAGYLQKFSDKFKGQGLQINDEVRSGPAARTILEYAASHAIDIIAMATHGRTGLQRWVYTSVTEKVLHAADFSVLVVRPNADSLN
jgi:nucleotide-binding universal stress UspA family protein